MSIFLTLLGVAAVTWLYRVSFTALVAADRLPVAVRDRMDAVTPAVFAALVVTDVAGTDAASVPAVLAALVAATVTALRTRHHIPPMIAAMGAWTVVALL